MKAKEIMQVVAIAVMKPACRTNTLATILLSFGQHISGDNKNERNGILLHKMFFLSLHVVFMAVYILPAEGRQ